MVDFEAGIATLHFAFSFSVSSGENHWHTFG
jgi:hypothetical protein